MQNLIGQSLGRYHIIEKLGEGGMAIVYKAFDTRLECEVAVKVIRTDQLAPAVLERALKRFEREAKAVAKLNHSNIVKVTDYGEHEGSPYLVMPFLSGGTFKSLIREKGKIPWQEAIRLILPVAEALNYAHSHDVIHRDVKPSNILLTDQGQPMLTDFGVAKIIEDEATQDLTGTSATVGTPEYMAPEQITSKSVDLRVDVYSLGVVFYELITGRRPFEADTPMAVLFKHASEPLPRPSLFVKSLPDNVEYFLIKALTKKPDDRYQNMREFVSALYKLMERQGLQGAQPLIAPNRQTAASDPDEYGTVDQRDPSIRQVSPDSVKKTNLPIQDKNVEPVAQPDQPIWLTPKVIGGALAGLIVLVLIIGASSGWFSAKTPAATQAPALTEAAATEAPAMTEAPVTEALTEAAAMTEAPEPAAGTIQISPKDGMPIVYVPTGDFLMGSPEGVGEDDEHPQHTVSLSGYWIDQTEVTNAMFAKFVQETGYKTHAESDENSYVFRNGNWEYVVGANWQHPQGPDSTIVGLEDHPVVHVDWDDATAYCDWAGRQLPTEAQWEKAARGEDGQIYPWGDLSPNIRLANFDATFNGTTAVGSFHEGISPYGALDMAGNVWEWVADWYDENYYSSQNSWVNPKGPMTSDYRALRGGSWSNNEEILRTTNRDKAGALLSVNNFGFRCTLDEANAENENPQSTLADKFLAAPDSDFARELANQEFSDYFFFDDFSQPQSVWDYSSKTYDSKSITKSNTDGKYAWEFTSPENVLYEENSFRHEIITLPETLSVYAIKIEIDEESSDYINDYCLIFGYKTEGEYVDFCILPKTQDYEIWKTVAATGTYLPYKETAGPVFKDGPNTLGLIVDSDQVLLFINDALIGKHAITEDFSGVIGISAKMNVGSNSTFAFDNFVAAGNY